MSKVKPNEISFNDKNLVIKLTTEINDLKQLLALRKKRGHVGEIEDQFKVLKEENEKLRQEIASKSHVEDLIRENRKLKLELQKISTTQDILPRGDSLLQNKLDSSIPSYGNLVTSPVHKSGLRKAGENIIQSNLSNIKGLKEAQDRLRFLESMEKNSSSKLAKQLEKIYSEKQALEEQKQLKRESRKRNIEKMEGHIKKINYLYRDNNNQIHSKYLKESTNRNKSTSLVTNARMLYY